MAAPVRLPREDVRVCPARHELGRLEEEQRYEEEEEAEHGGLLEAGRTQGPPPRQDYAAHPLVPAGGSLATVAASLGVTRYPVDRLNAISSRYYRAPACSEFLTGLSTVQRSSQARLVFTSISGTAQPIQLA